MSKKAEKSVSEIFKLAIAKNFYCPGFQENPLSHAKAHMCNSLWEMFFRGCISEKEYNKAEAAILRFMAETELGKQDTMRKHLRILIQRNEIVSDGMLLELYSKWPQKRRLIKKWKKL